MCVVHVCSSSSACCKPVQVAAKMIPEFSHCHCLAREHVPSTHLFYSGAPASRSRSSEMPCSQEGRDRAVAEAGCVEIGPRCIAVEPAATATLNRKSRT